nr:ORF3 [Raccoon dog Torque teno virus 1]
MIKNLSIAHSTPQYSPLRDLRLSGFDINCTFRSGGLTSTPDSKVTRWLNTNPPRPQSILKTPRRSKKKTSTSPVNSEKRPLEELLNLISTRFSHGSSELFTPSSKSNSTPKSSEKKSDGGSSKRGGSGFLSEEEDHEYEDSSLESGLSALSNEDSWEDLGGPLVQWVTPPPPPTPKGEPTVNDLLDLIKMAHSIDQH